MYAKRFGAVVALAASLIPSWAAASEPVEAAEYAVRSLIRSKMGSQYRIVFENASEKILSLTEEVVSGTGHVYDGSDWDFDRSFNFSVKVKYDGSSTRDVSVTFTNGEKQTEAGQWKKSNHKDTAVHLTSPRWYENLASGSVVFEGTARANLSIDVFDRNNRKVASQAANPNNGRFRVVIQLPSGQYRAVVSPGGWEVADEVRFTVNSSGQDWGKPAAYLKVAEPARDARLSNTRVTFSGNSSDRSVYLQVWDSRNNRIPERDIPVRDRYWNSQVILGDGLYRFTVTSGGSSESRDFSVSTGGGSKPKPTPGGVTVRVNDPSRDGIVSGPRVTVAGNSPDDAVLVQIWDERSNRIEERRVPSARGYFNTSIPMQPGRYLLRVTGHRGNDFEERWFTVSSNTSKPKPSPGLSVTVRVTDPKRDSVVSGPRVTVAGNSPDSAVLVQIWDTKNRQIEERRVPTSKGYFNTSVPMQPGRYLLRVTGHRGNDFEELWFTVR